MESRLNTIYELIFHGVILHRTSKKISFMGANILQALLFGLYHGNIVQGIYTIFLGLLFGMVYHRFMTICAPILLHMIFNASVFLKIYGMKNNLGYAIMTVLGGTFIIISWLILKHTDTTCDIVNIEEVRLENIEMK